MTTTASGRKATSACDGVTTAFAVPFRFIPDNFKLFLLDAADDLNEDGDLLTEGVDYTLSGDPRAGTAEVTTTTAYPVGKYIRRWRDTSRAQTADYVANDGFSAEGHETQLDRLSMVDEELADDLATADARVVSLEATVTALQAQVDALASPAFTFAVVTGAAGTDASIDVTGTFPDYLLTFTIPRGNPGGSGALGDGDYGGVIVSGGGTVLTVKDATLTPAKFAAFAANRLIGNLTGSAASPIEVTYSAVKSALAIDAVDNTSDAGKPVSTAQQTALDLKKNKAPNVQTAAGNSVTPTFDNDLVIRTGADGAITVNNPTGTAVDGWGFVLRLKDNGTARAISFDTEYRAIEVTLPTSTTIGKWLDLAMIYNLADDKWDVLAVAEQA